MLTDSEVYKDYDFLYNEYIIENKTQKEIGDSIGVSRKTIAYWLRKHTIKRDIPLYKKREWLYNEYINEKRSPKEIGTLYNISKYVVSYWIQKLGISMRTNAEAKSRELNPNWKENNSHNKEWLYEQYIVKKRSPFNIGKECGVNGTTIRYWLINFSIPIRNLNESKTGALNHNWKGGKYFKDGHEYVRISKKRYKSKSRIVIEKVIGRELKKGEVVHHINGNSINNKLENLWVCSNLIHSQAHSSFRKLLTILYKKEIVKFDKKKGVYKLNKNYAHSI